MFGTRNEVDRLALAELTGKLDAQAADIDDLRKGNRAMGEYIANLEGRLGVLSAFADGIAHDHGTLLSRHVKVADDLYALKDATERHVARVNRKLPMAGYGEAADEGTEEKTVTVTVRSRMVDGKSQVMLTSEPSPNEIGPRLLVDILRQMLRYYEAKAAEAEAERSREQQAAANRVKSNTWCWCAAAKGYGCDCGSGNMQI